MPDTAGQKLIENPVVKSKPFFMSPSNTLIEKTTPLLWNVILIRAELILDGPEQVPPCQFLWFWSGIAESRLRAL
ncbi:unnamed protein product [Penicillium discolor]